VKGLVRREFCDLNRSPSTAYQHPKAKTYYDYYHGKIEQYVDEVFRSFPNDIPILIDIHGQSDEPDCLIRGTANGLTVKKLIERKGEESITGVNSLFGYLKNRNYNIFPGNMSNIGINLEHQNYNGGFTVRRYSGSRDYDNTRKLDNYLDSIQIEIGIQYRSNVESEIFDQLCRDISNSIIHFYRTYLQEQNIET